MKIKSDCAEMASDMALARSVIARKEIMSQMALSAKDGVLHVTGMCSAVSVTSKIDAQVEEDGYLLMDGKKLVDILKASKGDLSLSTGKQVSIKAGRAKFRALSLDVELPIPDLGLPSLEVEVNASDLERVIGLAAYASATNDVRYYLNGIHISLKDHVITCAGTDGHRLSLVRMNCESDGEFSVIVQKGGIPVIRKALQKQESCRVSVFDEHILLSTDRHRVSCVLFDGRYPDVDRVIPRHETYVVIDQVVMIGALKRAKVLSNEKYRTVVLCADGGELEITATNKDQDEAKEVVDVSGNGSFRVGVNVDYLIEAFEHFPVGQDVKFFYGKQDQAVKLVGVGDHEEPPQLIAVVMPVRV